MCRTFFKGLLIKSLVTLFLHSYLLHLQLVIIFVFSNHCKHYLCFTTLLPSLLLNSSTHYTKAYAYFLSLPFSFYNLLALFQPFDDFYIISLTYHALFSSYYDFPSILLILHCILCNFPSFNCIFSHKAFQNLL